MRAFIENSHRSRSRTSSTSAGYEMARALTLAELVVLLCMVACTHSRPDNSHDTNPNAPTASRPPAPEHVPAVQPAEPAGTSSPSPSPSSASPPNPSSSGQPPSSPSPSTASAGAVSSINDESARAPASRSGSSSASRPAAKPAPGGKAAATAAAASGSAAPNATRNAPQVDSGRKPGAEGQGPALDLTSLEQRLKETHAIGLFTKLSLKNQVDDLLAGFRTFHAGQTPPTLSDLRQRYDLLLLKVLTLLQDGDPALASAISASRDAIWGILADRESFQKI